MKSYDCIQRSIRCFRYKVITNQKCLYQLVVVLVFLMLHVSATAQVVINQYVPFKFSTDIDISQQSKEQIKQELEKISQAQADLSPEDIQKINYWQNAYPSYRWHQIMMQVSKEHKGHKNGGRVVILHLAIYDALVDVLKYKAMYDQSSPFEMDDSIRKLGRKHAPSSIACESSAAAGAAHRIISYYFPERLDHLDSLLTEFVDTRLQTGLQLSSGIQSGLEIGRAIAEQYIAYAKTDRTDKTWDGEVPQSDSLWSGNPGKWDPMKRQWRPLTLESADQFRPPPPPTDWTKDMEELRQFNATHDYSEIAWKWKSAPVWDNLVERKIMEYDLDPIAAAFSNAVFHTARFDGIIAAWDGKYHYWGIRPFQYDPSFKPILIDTPNFPGYPAGHTTVAGSIATALAFLFPQDAQMFHEMAWECSESRFEGGAHFRTDNEVGVEVGNKVGEQVIKVFTEHLK